MRGQVLATIVGATLVAAACGGTTEPPASAWTMQATIDGIPWFADQASGHYSTGSQSLLIIGQAAWDTSRRIALALEPVRGPTTVTLAKPLPPGGSWANLTKSWGGFITDETFQLLVYFTTDTLTGSATITEFDLSAQRVAGTFSFVGEAARTGDTVRVTDGTWTGRLDITN